MKKKIYTVIVFVFFLITAVFFGCMAVIKNKTNIPSFSNEISKSLKTNEIKSSQINIVFSTDKKYKDYLKTALKSSIINKDPNTFYNIHILCIDLPKKEQEKFKSFEEKNVKITIVPLKLRMLNKVGNYGIIGRSHVSRADLFKFFIPEMFKDYDKILYLDCDILVLKDLSKLYNTNLEDKFIGVVQESYFNQDFQYNCGMILFDVKKCVKYKIAQKLMQAKNKDKKHIYITQPFFHEVLDYDKVKLLPLEFNRFASVNQEEFVKNGYKKLYYLNNKEINTLEDVDKRMVVLHFLAYKKPWQYDKIPFAPLWWKYAHLVNPDWKVEKRSAIQNFKLAFELTLAANREKKFKQIKGFLDKYREYYDYLSDKEINR